MKSGLLCYNPLLRISRSFMEKLFLPAVKCLFTCCFAILAATVAFGQIFEPNTGSAKSTAPKPAAPKPSPTPKPASKDPKKPATAEEIAEATIFYYAFPGGRATLDQIRKTTL